ncbi:MAG: TraB/GumN family protein [Pseudomonadota bacterium]
MKRHFDSANLADRASKLFLTLLGFLNVVFVFLLMLTAGSVTKANAEQMPVCSGQNLLTQLANDEPAAHAEILKTAKNTPFAQSLLFKIEKDGVKPSWLFGTMHMTDPRIVNLSDKAQNAFERADTLIIESDEVLDMTKAQLALLGRPDLQMFTGDERLTDFINAEERAVLEAGLQKRGLQLALINRMQPWMVTGLVALPACEMQRKQAGELFLDLALADRAEATGKTIAGLETIVEQLEALASLPVEFHIQGLVETIKLGDAMDDVIETMIQLYLDENIAAVMPTLETVATKLGGTNDDEGYAAFEEKIVVNRNHIMAERAQPYLDDGGVFLAVGALHLPGDEGVAQLLEDAGYLVSPVFD